MYKNITDDLFESLLGLAVYENSLSEAAVYPEAEIEQITISVNCDIKLKKINRKVKLTKSLKSAFHTLAKAAAFVGIGLGISFTALLFNSEVRATCYNVVVNFYEKYVEILIHPSTSDKEVYITAGYIPEGYTLTDNDTDKYMSTLVYHSMKGEQLFIQYSQFNVNQQIDVENYQIRTITIGSATAKLFSALEPDFSNMLILYSDNGSYTIIANLSEDELIKIAENIK